MTCQLLMIDASLPSVAELLIPYIINGEISVIFPIMAGLAELHSFRRVY